MRLLVRDGWVIRSFADEVRSDGADLDQRSHPLRLPSYLPGRADVLIEGDKIVGVGPGLARTAGPGDTVIEAAGKLVMPGLVNAHTHSFENLFRGGYDGLPLELWMLSAYAPLAYGPFGPRLIYLRTMLGAVDMIRSGVTCLQDHLTEPPQPTFEGASAAMEAYRDSGLRASVALNLGDRPWLQSLPFVRELLPDTIRREFGSPPPAKDLVAFCRKVITTWNGFGGRLQVVPGPSAPQRCTDEFLLQMNELAREFALPLHTHLLETKTQAVTGAQLYGRSTVRHLKDLGLLSDRLTVAHGIWVNSEDIRLLGEASVTVVHNPVSNLGLGSGVMPLRRLADAGVNLALGTDGVSSSGTLSVFEVVKLACYLQRIAGPDHRSWPTSGEMLRMATLGGLRSALFHEAAGTLEPGKKADLLVLDLDSGGVRFTPLNDIRNHLAFSENGSSVRTVVANGKVLMEDRRLVSVDPEAVVAEVNELMPAFRQSLAASAAWGEKLFVYVDEARRRSESRDWEGSRR